MDISVKFIKESKEIEVEFIKKINSKEKDSKFSFLLAKSFNIEEVIFLDKKMNWDKEEESVDLLPELYRYTINLPNISSDLIIKYRGNLRGNHRYYSDYLIHFSLYNVWYPLIEEDKAEYNISLDIGYDWELIRGKYNHDKKRWEISYIDEAFNDCNILLVNKEVYRIVENNFVKIYFLDYQKNYAKYILDNYTKVNEYYEKLYGRENSYKENIAILPYNKEWPNSDYKRDRLTVLTTNIEKIDMNSLFSHSLKNFAHEMGHNYGCGADASTWEDWLNETIAEWSALLYIKNVEKRDINTYIEEHKKYLESDKLILNPKGVDHPKDVHDVGTLIFYSIFVKYGEESIKKLLISFDKLKDKNTKNYLDYLDNNGLEYLSDEIRKYII